MGIAIFALGATHLVFSAAHLVVGAMKQSTEVATSAMRKQIPGA
jgi:hypothetical protein